MGTEAVTVRVEYTTPCVTQIVTVCDPGYSYDEVKCKDVEQETCYNAPELVRVSCEDLTAEKCVTVPEVEEAEQEVEVCRQEIGAPKCDTVSLELPKEHCIEIVYGYAHGFGKRL